jgi:hypothetical protein
LGRRESIEKRGFLTLVLVALALSISLPLAAFAQLKPGDPIVIGIPPARGSIEGGDG